MAPQEWETVLVTRRAHGHLWPVARPPRPRPGRPRPPTWDQAFGILLGPLGFIILAATLPSATSGQLVGLAYLFAGLAGIGVSAVDDLRSDWRARMVWSVGALLVGAVLMAASTAGIVSRAVQVAGLSLQVFAGLAILRALRRRRFTLHLVAAASAAAPTVLIVMVLARSPGRAHWIPGALEALSLIAFGLLRVARRPRGQRMIARNA
jgi:hypothetical protein